MHSDLVDLGNDHSDLRDAIARICADFDGSYWRRLDEERAYPREFVDRLTQSGYLGCLIPTEYGGSGLPLRAASVILETIHRSGCNAGACHAQMYTMGTVLRHGSAGQKAHYLPKIATGELRLQAFGVTEPTTGSDTTQLRTWARRDGDDYVINGQKVWTSRALHSDLMLLLARTTPVEQVKRRSDGLSVFLIDLNRARGQGLEIRPLKAMINHHATEVFFEDLRVPADTLVGREGEGFRYILDGMNAERILVASEALGDARWFIEKARRYASDRVVFGRPIGQNQAVQFPIVQSYVAVEAAELMVRKAAARFDAGAPCGAEANMAKLLAADASWSAAEACLQTYGGFGFASEYDIERKWRETRLLRTAPVSTNMVLAFLGQNVLDMPRSY
ncbi:MAG TPA: acyl-CoA dehydrogenase family protein [Burkholderiaceae bacterium]|nr:acyl-CoA dehydrogenase family protein [Burkholderiaceae bacterium]